MRWMIKGSDGSKATIWTQTIDNEAHEQYVKLFTPLQKVCRAERES